MPFILILVDIDGMRKLRVTEPENPLRREPSEPQTHEIHNKKSVQTHRLLPVCMCLGRDILFPKTVPRANWLCRSTV